MANKNFKVKTGLDLPAPLPVEMGGTGQTTTSNTLNAILPIQTDNNGKYLSTDGTSTAWSSVPTPLAQISEPSSPTDGLIWVDTDGFAAGQQVIRWYQLPASGTTVLSGLDQNSLPLSYTPGYELVFINGTLISRYSDYTATNGSTVTLSTATNAGDIVEIFGTQSIATADVYTQTQADSRYMLNTNSSVAGKNKFINGDFGVWQRGTSLSLSAGNNYLADRWNLYLNAATVTCSRQTFTPGTAPVSGYEGTYFLRWAQTSGGASTNQFQQRLEDVRLFAGQACTFSFWAKADSSMDVSLRWEQNFGSGGSADVKTTGSSVTLTTSWVRYSFTFTPTSVSGKTIGTNSYFSVGLLFNSAQTKTMDIWGCQLEQGSTATAFQTATGTIQGELAACQRYYQVIGGTASQFPLLGGYSTSTTTNIRYPITFTVTMRTAPTGTKNGTWAKSNCNEPIVEFVGAYGFTLTTTSTGNGVNWYLYPDSTDDTITLSAEL